MASIVVFDGVCNLCNWVVQLIIRHDPDGHFQFASLQSEAGRALLESHGLNAIEPETIVLVRDERVSTMSDAALEIARDMGSPFSLLYPLIVLPKGFRDWAYRIVARNRYRWFGRRDSCMMPTPELKRRFLDA
jgi:predicted DCC family thiol-disulfide oxidoreductase YuxK